jgi:F420-0:gamma-glutamyl ligase-like protein
VLEPNEGKALTIDIGGETWARYPIKTRLVLPEDDLFSVIEEHAAPHLQPGDILIMSERMVAVTQGRAYPIKEIEPSRLAHFLVRFVHKSPYGIGLGSGWTMELALREVGRPRILAAAAAAAITKPFGLRGVFYRVAGRDAAAIDGPTDNTLPPFNEYATLGPKDAPAVARRLKQRFGCEVVIIDANDLGVAVLGHTDGVTERFAEQVFRDNPLGQSSQQTPLCVVRRA